MDTTGVDLLPGEQLLWEDRPVRYRFLRGSDGLVVAFAAGWLVFMNVVFVFMLEAGPPPLLFVMWPLFIAYGLYLLVGRLVIRVIALRHTRYALTDRRLVVVGGLSWARAKTNSTYVSALPPPVITERPDGSGSLAFGAFPGPLELFLPGNRGLWRTVQQTARPVLWDIPNVRAVRDLFARAQAG